MNSYEDQYIWKNWAKLETWGAYVVWLDMKWPYIVFTITVHNSPSPMAVSSGNPISSSPSSACSILQSIYLMKISWYHYSQRGDVENVHVLTPDVLYKTICFLDQHIVCSGRRTLVYSWWLVATSWELSFWLCYSITYTLQVEHSSNPSQPRSYAFQMSWCGSGSSWAGRWEAGG